MPSHHAPTEFSFSFSQTLSDQRARITQILSDFPKKRKKEFAIKSVFSFSTLLPKYLWYPEVASFKKKLKIKKKSEFEFSTFLM
jgi:hypothetical protein